MSLGRAEDPSTGPLRLLAVVVLAAVMVGSGCGGDGTTRLSDGEIPDSVPPDLPIPPGSTVTEALVDRDDNRTEVALLLDWETDAVIRFYTVELVSNGFVVERSEARSGGWQIAFRRVDLVGTITVRTGEGGGATALLVLNRS